MYRHLAITITTAFLLVGCATPDFDYPREASSAIDPATDTFLKRDVDRWLAENPGPSGFFPVVHGNDALGARLRLMEVAEKTIDAQYFLMKSDSAGYVFANGLVQAADRGVRVRLLLDDIFTTVEDDELAILDSYQNIEVRLFNPIARAGSTGFNYLGDFKAANRRMHNKSFIADNQAAVVGGRNIADEYFEIGTEGMFLDFDVIAFGPVAAEVSEEFDMFWNHERSLPLEGVIGQKSEEELRQFLEKLDNQYLDRAREIYAGAVNSDLMRDIDDSKHQFFSADAIVLTDDPNKLVSEISEENMIMARDMAEIVRQAESEVIVLSPYFVPGDSGVAFWKSIVDKGVRVVVITNGLASNNHTSVHSGYARYRKALIEAGIELHEARANAASTRGGGEDEPLTMHTKSMIFDRSRLFVGSLNLDPRSIEINSEMGMVIDSPEMTGQLATRLFDSLSDWTYRVVLDEDGKLRWHATIDGVDVVETNEPLTSWWKRFSAWFLKIAPERQL